ncbi:MAG: alpha/beta hydrolase, partial [Streptosporangiaceae bacterium]
IATRLNRIGGGVSFDFRGTKPMRRVHWAVERRPGRFYAKNVLNTRISSTRWDPEPVPPAEAAAMIAPTPLLVVHGDKDHFFPPDHAEEIYAAAREPKDLWIVPGFGHAESAASAALVDRIGRWVTKAIERSSTPAEADNDAVA